MQPATAGTIDGAALDRLRKLFCKDRIAVSREISDWFYSYHSDLYVHGLPFDVYVSKAKAILKELSRSRRILDVGAGFGVYACLLRILGVPEVVALDYHFKKTLAAARLVRYLGLDGIRILHGDATVLPFPARTFDAAIALASLSHIRDAQRALTEIARILPQGGRLYVFEDNNSSYPGYGRMMRPIWEGAETGIYPANLPPEKRIPEPYLSIRRRIIRERYAQLGPEDLELCARVTRGQYGAHIFKAVQDYLTTGRTPDSKSLPPRDPVNGECLEYPLNPSVVELMCRRAGFEARVKSPLTWPFRGRWRAAKRLAADVLKICPALLRWTWPTFVIVGIPRGKPQAPSAT